MPKRFVFQQPASNIRCEVKAPKLQKRSAGRAGEIKSITSDKVIAEPGKFSSFSSQRHQWCPELYWGKQGLPKNDFMARW